jgi:high-affinity iron transporter
MRYLSVKIPLRPFFIATSVLLGLLAFTFAGSGIKELQEGDVIAMTPLPGLPSVDLLGFYPTAQTLAAQAGVLVILIAGLAISFRKARIRRTTTEQEITV